MDGQVKVTAEAGRLSLVELNRRVMRPARRNASVEGIRMAVRHR
jgi:hypothetical protein